MNFFFFNPVFPIQYMSNKVTLTKKLSIFWRHLEHGSVRNGLRICNFAEIESTVISLKTFKHQRAVFWITNVGIPKLTDSDDRPHPKYHRRGTT